MELEGSLPHSQVPSPVPILNQLDLVHRPTSHFLKIQINIILPSKPGSPKWSLSFRFPHQNSVYASPLPHTCYILLPSHSSPFYHPKNTGWRVQIFKLLILQFFPLLCHISLEKLKFKPGSVQWLGYEQDHCWNGVLFPAADDIVLFSRASRPPMIALQSPAYESISDGTCTCPSTTPGTRSKTVCNYNFIPSYVFRATGQKCIWV